MAADDLPDDARILARAYEDRVRELFKTFVEGVVTGEPERDAVIRFRRALISARQVYTTALKTVKELDSPKEVEVDSP
jgi:hypothetical protein